VAESELPVLDESEALPDEAITDLHLHHAGATPLPARTIALNATTADEIETSMIEDAREALPIVTVSETAMIDGMTKRIENAEKTEPTATIEKVCSNPSST